MVTKLSLVQLYVKTLLWTFVQHATLSTQVSKKLLILAVVLTDSVNVSVHVHLRSNSLNIRILKKALIGAFFIALCITAQAEPEYCPQLSDIPQNKLKVATVEWIADGDTLHTTQGDKLRLLHINAPEINPKSKKPAEPLAIEAKLKLSQLAGKKQTIYWFNDSRQKDKFGRELALIFNHKRQFINAELVSAGLAQTLVIPPNQVYWQCIKSAEQQAINDKRGIWSGASFTSASQAKPNQGFQLVKGKISKIKDSRRYRWLILEDSLWVGLPRKQMSLFSDKKFKMNLGDEIKLRGYIYKAHGEKRVKLNHPAMLF